MIPELEMAQDRFDHGRVLDQADDLHWAPAARAGQRVGLIYLLN